ncbi:hypothetical protein TWF696_001147 [Orbilia brochopaga]|uniref:C2H2-type domain-containing protein n=1 Tax=Orbilia brochopaga TaxID=3140254 RepID=A0AAV9VDJ7_9PEZI
MADLGSDYYPPGLLPPYPISPPAIPPHGYHPYPFCKGDYTKYCPDPFLCPCSSVWLREDVFFQLHFSPHNGSYTLPDIDEKLLPFEENKYSDSCCFYTAEQTRLFQYLHGWSPTAAAVSSAATSAASASITPSTDSPQPTTPPAHTIVLNNQQSAATDLTLLLNGGPSGAISSGIHSSATTLLTVSVTAPATSDQITDANTITSTRKRRRGILEQPTIDPGATASTADSSPSSATACKWGNCDFLYPTQREALEHIKSDHIGSRKNPKHDFTCRIRDCACGGKVFEKRDNVVSHITNVAFDIRYAVCPFKTDGCKVALKREWDLPRHIKICRFNPASERKKRKKTEDTE